MLNDNDKEVFRKYERFDVDTPMEDRADYRHSRITGSKIAIIMGVALVLFWPLLKQATERMPVPRRKRVPQQVGWISDMLLESERVKEHPSIINAHH